MSVSAVYVHAKVIDGNDPRSLLTCVKSKFKEMKGRFQRSKAYLIAQNILKFLGCGVLLTGAFMVQYGVMVGIMSGVTALGGGPVLAIVLALWFGVGVGLWVWGIAFNLVFRILETMIR